MSTKLLTLHFFTKYTRVTIRNQEQKSNFIEIGRKYFIMFKFNVIETIKNEKEKKKV
jgi:hypothetical protein